MQICFCRKRVVIVPWRESPGTYFFISLLYSESELNLIQILIHVSCNIICRCKCGHCSLTYITKKEELSCCTEIQQCMDALTDELVIADIGEGTKLRCITEHPGFAEVCLARWSLRVAAARFKTRGNQRYRQRESEEKYVNITTKNCL